MCKVTFNTNRLTMVRTSVIGCCVALQVCVQFAGVAECVEPSWETHWSFRKAARVSPPPVDSLEYADRIQNPIDAFVFSRLAAEDLEPAPQASRYTLLRRAYFDLLGLPPTQQQVEDFVRDDSPQAWPNLINELLKSKHYGERWGRHWLDIARYSDSGGYETDIYYRNAWRYRDYVVKSFNDDKPYDRFVQEQIAGDEIWPDNLDLEPRRVYQIAEKQRQHLEAHIATGLYTLGPLVHESGLDARRLKYETLTDWVDTTASMFLGLTMGCARCHDHKFDSLTQADYFGLQAVFADSCETELPLLTAMEIADWRQHYPHIIAVDEARRAYKLFEKKTAGRQRTAEEEEHRRRLLESVGQAVLRLPERASSVPNSPFDALMGRPVARVLGHERPELAKPIYLLERGELQSPGQQMKPALPVMLANVTGAKVRLDENTGKRKQLAVWLTHPEHPLTSRVMINRLWHWHFGQGLVPTPNDFGSKGTPPSHPRLLDWLANQFVSQGWSVKQMHRLIMTSATYQMSSSFGSQRHQEVDPDNRLLWRMSRRRLEAEALWDSVHSVAGTLNLTIGGRPVVPPLADDEIAALRESWHWPVSADPQDHTRRGLYVLVRRNFPFPMFEVFDAPVTSSSCPKRDVTTVAPQALWSLNSPSVVRQALFLAGRVAEKASTSDQRIETLWLTSLGRPPLEREVKEALLMMAGLREIDDEQAVQLLSAVDDLPTDLAKLPPREAASLALLCLSIYNLNEFAFID